ncbi:unnamed protein product [Pleuronectes platessa]|uniref:Uncharacterized protein n=1 Tax=Pleuronectes platessa TaxID=8262 RepID=A0A9N7VK33_PLEPL|nr:unnamed protein product [Pleuronectes platessa]
MSWLSPVSWAKWTWTAVRGGEGEDEEGEASEQRGERGEEREEDERSQGFSSDSEGNFGTPEAATPVHVPATILGELENNNTDAEKTDLDQDEHLIVTAPVDDHNSLLRHNMGQDEPVVPMGGPLEINMQTLEEEKTDALGSMLVPDSSSVKETPQQAECTVPSSEASRDTEPILHADPVLDLAPAQTAVLISAPAPISAPISAPAPAPISAPAPAPAPISAAISAPAPAPISAPAPVLPHCPALPHLSPSPSSCPNLSPSPSSCPNLSPSPSSCPNLNPSPSSCPNHSPSSCPNLSTSTCPNLSPSSSPCFCPSTRTRLSAEQ